MIKDFYDFIWKSQLIYITLQREKLKSTSNILINKRYEQLYY